MKAGLKKNLRLESKLVPLAIISLIAIIIAVPILKRKNHGDNVAEVKRGSIVQWVIVTGKAKPAEVIDLAFEKSGRVSSVNFKVSDKVKPGEILVKLETSELEANLLEAEANRETQEAKLDEIKKGSRPEEIEIQEARLTNTKSNLEDSRKNLVDKITDAYVKADDATRNKTDQLFSNPESASPQLTFPVANTEAKSKIEWGRFMVGKSLNAWLISTANLDSESDLAENTKTAKDNLSLVKTLLENAGVALSSASPSQNLNQSTLDGYKSDISNARINVSTAINNLTAAEEKLKTAESNVSIAEKELALKKSGSTPEQIKYQEAQVKQAKAKVLAVQAQIAKNILRSPILGLVTRQNAKPGEIVAPNTNLVSIISESNLEVEANISEINIENINIGNPVKITFDAFPEETFVGQISQIDPAETVIDGVVNFKTKIIVLNSSPKLKSGLTANLEIETLRKDTVLISPKSAIIEEGGQTFVNKLTGGKIEKTLVVVGIKSRDGSVEILSGLNEGDAVIIAN